LFYFLGRKRLDSGLVFGVYQGQERAIQRTHVMPSISTMTQGREVSRSASHRPKKCFPGEQFGIALKASLITRIDTLRDQRPGDITQSASIA
jgi:hypothetical protein